MRGSPSAHWLKGGFQLHRAVLRQGVILLALVVFAALLAAPAGAGTARISSDRYIVVLAGNQKASGFQLAGTRQTATAAVAAAGGTVLRDLSRQIGVMIVRAPDAGFASRLRSSGLVSVVGADFSWQGLSTAKPDPTSDPR